MTESQVTQRLVAILAADVYGYSRLMQDDAQATVATLDASRQVFREHIVAHQGRVVDMAGDAVLAVFETAIGAAEAAMRIQAALTDRNTQLLEHRQMLFRIGVHLGDVIEKPDGTVYGDGVNIAARLQGLAEPGGITVSVAVHGAVGNRLAVAFVDQGEREVKNMAPVRAFAINAKPSAAGDAAKPSITRRERPSIAVLPFANMSGDPEQEYFADGIAEDIITELSRFRSIFVIAR